MWFWVRKVDQWVKLERYQFMVLGDRLRDSRSTKNSAISISNAGWFDLVNPIKQDTHNH